MKRRLIDFSVRTKDACTLETLATRVGEALDCELRSSAARSEGPTLFEGRALGLRITLSEWPPFRESALGMFQLHGSPATELIQPDSEYLPIDDHVIAALEEGGAGLWHVPDEAEIDAEIRYAEQFE